jgi:hypothetical protein
VKSFGNNAQTSDKLAQTCAHHSTRGKVLDLGNMRIMGAFKPVAKLLEGRVEELCSENEPRSRRKRRATSRQTVGKYTPRRMDASAIAEGHRWFSTFGTDP